MSRANPKLLEFAGRLIAEETRGKKSSGASGALFPVIERLRPDLLTLMGSMGFRALLSRALALASAEIAWLSAVHVRSDGSLEELDWLELEAQIGPEAITGGHLVLLAQLLQLLVDFIGEDLTLRLVREVWREAPPDFNFGKGE